MKKFEELKNLLAEAEKDAESFYNKANKAAGTRLRNAMQKLKVAATEIRKEVTEKKNTAAK
jgi:vacuolar-type H+-ATPase subunit H